MRVLTPAEPSRECHRYQPNQKCVFRLTNDIAGEWWLCAGPKCWDSVSAGQQGDEEGEENHPLWSWRQQWWGTWWRDSCSQTIIFMSWHHSSHYCIHTLRYVLLFYSTLHHKRMPFLTGSKPNKSSNHKLRFSSGTQTDPSLNIFPYETLFPHALPLIGSSHLLGKPLPPQQQLLESYIDSAAASYSTADLKTQLQILRSQLLFETGRRETLGARNRRLLGFTKNVRELEEQNLALVDKLHMARQEIATLQTQLTTVTLHCHFNQSLWRSSKLKSNPVTGENRKT